MKIGYARVPTQDQDAAAQVAALKKAGCERIFKEKASGGRWDRLELHRQLEQMRKGDVLVVWKLNRLSHAARLFNVHPSAMSRLLQRDKAFQGETL